MEAMELLFHGSRDSYRAGRLAECRGYLSRVQLKGFSVLRWYLEYNLLTSHLQELLLEGDIMRTDVQSILLGYEKLWNRMNGLPPSPCSVCVELAVTLALCQAHSLLGHWDQLQPLISAVLKRVGQINSSSSVISLNAVDDARPFGEETVRSLKKLRVFKALGNLNRPEGTAGAITAHSQWLGGAAAEADYRKAWLLFNNEEYILCLQTLCSSSLSVPGHPLTPLAHILQGACHAKLGHHHIALLYWKTSMETGNTSSHTPFLAALMNFALTYTETGNITAALATRRLHVEALRSRSHTSKLSLPMWVWLDCGVGVATKGMNAHPITTALSHLAWQQARGQRYEEASESLQECLQEIESGAVAELGAAPPSSLRLLQAFCDVAGGGDRVDQGSITCQDLLQASPAPNCSLWRSKVMCLLASASLCLGECDKSQVWGVRCLRVLEEEREKIRDSLGLSQLHLLQCHAQILVSLTAIAHAHWREALQLLSCVLTTPTGLYNHSLLQCRLGIILGGAKEWLEKRGKLPAGQSEARKQLKETQLQHNQASDRERNCLAMDIAMLMHWIQHKR